MLESLTGGPATAGELAALLPIAREGVSRHLRVLREAGLVEVRQEAQRRGHRLLPQPPAAGGGWMGPGPGCWGQRLRGLPSPAGRGRPGRRGTAAADRN